MHRVASSVEISAPREDCFQTWMDFESFPDFMSQVLEVRPIPQGWHWVVKGPMGKIVEWEGQIDLVYENKSVSWSTPPDAEVANSGTVNFLELSPNQTLVELTMTFSPPAAPIGELITDILHYPDHLVKRALEEFKNYVERRYSGRRDSGFYNKVFSNS